MKTRLFTLVAALWTLMALAAPAHAQIAISRSPLTSPVLGLVVNSSSASTFTVSTSGAVTRTSGNHIRLSSASVTPPTITISCGFLNLDNFCALRQVRVTVTAVSNPNARITGFHITSLLGNLLYAGQTPPSGPSMTFDLKPLGLLGTGSFTLGMDVWVSGGLSSSQYTFDYVVTATFI
jgi:hypothetical protein